MVCRKYASFLFITNLANVCVAMMEEFHELQDS